MFCTDSLEDVAVHPALKAARSVPAKHIHVIRFDFFIPKMLEPNRRLWVALHP